MAALMATLRLRWASEPEQSRVVPWALPLWWASLFTVDYPLYHACGLYLSGCFPEKAPGSDLSPAEKKDRMG